MPRGDRSIHPYRPVHRGVAGYKGFPTDDQADPARIDAPVPVGALVGDDPDTLVRQGGAALDLAPGGAGNYAPPIPQSDVSGLEDALAAAGGGLAIYGDGHHGAVVLDGIATFPFADLVGSVYKLSDTLYATDITISPGVTLDANCWPIYARGTLDNQGIITAGLTADSHSGLIPGGAGADGSSNAGAAGNTPSALNTVIIPGAAGAGGAAGRFAGGAGGFSEDGRLHMQRSSLGGGTVFWYPTIGGRFPWAGTPGGGSGATLWDTAGSGGHGGQPLVIAARLILQSGACAAPGVDGLGAAANVADPLAWQALTPYLGAGAVDPILPVGHHIYLNLGADGTSGAAEPTWLDDGSDITDNDITWTDQGERGAGGGGGGQGGLMVLLYDIFTGTLPVAATDCPGGAFGAGINAGSPGVAGDPGLVVAIANR